MGPLPAKYIASDAGESSVEGHQVVLAESLNCVPDTFRRRSTASESQAGGQGY